VHQSTPFATRKTLERRIAMILDANRVSRRTSLIRSLVLPLAVIGVTAGLLIAGAGERSLLRVEQARLAQAGRPAPAARQAPSIGTLDPATVWIDSVQFGTLPLQVRALGVLVAVPGGRFKAELQVASVRAGTVQLGQPASIEVQKVVFPGTV